MPLVEDYHHRHIISTLLFAGEEYDEILKKEISYVRNCDISVSDYPSSFGEMFPLIFNGYRAKKQEFKKIDFDDMMWEAEKLLQNDRLCQKYWDRYLFMLLDEFQDINPIQFRIVKRILNERKNIFAVGDDDQSIYGFRGSDPKIMLSFTKEFNNAKTVCLRYNYRSSKRVVEAAIKLISNNKNRFFKDIRPYQKGTGAVFCHQFVSDEQEAFFICSRIKKAKENKEKKTVGILYRNHKDARILQYMLQKFKLKEEWLHLHTYHGAKGLEFDEVYLIHVNEGLTPSYSPEDDVEEERRMFYVAITRAKNRLYICCIKNRGGKICHPSRFIHELQS